MNRIDTMVKAAGARLAPQDPEFEEKVRASFGMQKVMGLIGATLARIAPGEVEIELGYRPDLTQQNGFLHAGIVSTILDSACGYAAYTLLPAGVGVLTVEYKINLLAPASGSRFRASGRIERAGRTLTVCTGEVVALQENGHERTIAVMLSTLMAIREHTSGDEG
jgi:uncharacterized protein (TIGR00369 family)